MPLKEPLKLSEQDTGREVALRVGEKLEITLAGNPTTGYSWEAASVDTNILKQVGERKYQRDSNLIGAGGKFTFSFDAIAPGKTALQLTYRRPWEKNVPPAKKYEIIVTVKLRTRSGRG
jgi:inhibitor of cysteine peptidase